MHEDRSSVVIVLSIIVQLSLVYLRKRLFLSFCLFDWEMGWLIVHLKRNKNFINWTLQYRKTDKVGI